MMPIRRAALLYEDGTYICKIKLKDTQTADRTRCILFTGTFLKVLNSKPSYLYIPHTLLFGRGVLF